MRRRLTTYRSTFVRERATLVNRVQKVLESANIKLASVASDVMGVSGQAMLEAIIEGQASPAEMAELAQKRMRAKRDLLAKALEGWVKPHHLLGFEALLRWQSPTRGLTPMQFLEVAENTGLISAIDRWVFKESLLQLRYWDSVFPNIVPLTMSANISGKHVAQMGLVDEIASVLKETGMDASRLNLEIAENTVMENASRTNEVFANIHALGVQLQVDDFGIGYSSLGYLSSFTLNALKIDRSFINSLGQESTNLKIIQAILIMSRGLGMKVTAEGVETQDQFEQLRELGCEFAQGYLIAMPLTKEDATQLLEKIFGPNNGKTDPWNFLE